MARSDLLVSLVKAVASGDRRLMRSTVEAIIAEERSKQHNMVADRLTKAMNDMDNGVHHPHPAPVEPVHRGRDFIAELQPQRRLEELVLPDSVRTACNQLIEEHHRADLLRAHSLEPRHRALLVGPPGNGKTTLAEGVAEALALPLFVVRYELMIGSYLGETASRLKRLFDYVRTTPCLLFFDEFDVLGKERGTHTRPEKSNVLSRVYCSRSTICRAIPSLWRLPIMRSSLTARYGDASKSAWNCQTRLGNRWQHLSRLSSAA